MKNTTDEVSVIESLSELGAIEGVHYFISGDRVYPIVAGGATGDDDDDSGEDEEDQEEGDPSDEDDETEEDEKPKLITEEEMRKIASREKKDGRRTGRNALLKELGVEDVDEALRLIDAGRSKAKKKGEGDDSDGQSEREDQDAKKARNRERLNGKAERALIRAGADDDERTLAGLLVMLDIEDDFDEDDITTAVEDLKEGTPALFGVATTKKKVKASDPGGTGERKTSGGTSAADALWKRRKG